MVVDEYEQFNNNNSNDDDDADVVLVSPAGSVDEPEPEPPRADDCKPSFDACPLNNKRGAAVRYGGRGAYHSPGTDRACYLFSNHMANGPGDW